MRLGPISIGKYPVLYTIIFNNIDDDFKNILIVNKYFPMKR